MVCLNHSGESKPPCGMDGELVDLVCLNGGARDLCFSLCYRVHFTPLPPIFEHPQGCRRSGGDLSSSGEKSAIDGSWFLGIRGVVFRWAKRIQQVVVCRSKCLRTTGWSKISKNKYEFCHIVGSDLHVVPMPTKGLSQELGRFVLRQHGRWASWATRLSQELGRFVFDDTQRLALQIGGCAQDVEQDAVLLRVDNFLQGAL